MINSMTDIEQIESRFLEVTGLNMDLSKWPIRKSDYKEQQQATSKKASKEFGFVTTPIFVVDAMIALKKELSPEQSILDLCAGCGQFSIRIMRHLYNKFGIEIKKWLKEKHNFLELQLINCAKLVYIFGPEINLYCGDAKKINEIPDDANGVMFYDDDSWKQISEVNELLKDKRVCNNLKILEFIFENHKNSNKLKKLLEKLKII